MWQKFPQAVTLASPKFKITELEAKGHLKLSIALQYYDYIEHKASGKFNKQCQY